MTTKNPPRHDDRSTIDHEIALKTRRSLLTGGLAAAAGFGLFRWLGTRSPEGGVPWPLRRSLEANERLTQAYFDPARDAARFPVASAEAGRVNGDVGMDDDDEIDPANWQLEVSGLGASSSMLSLAALQALPKVEFVTELKCIEGWSRRVRWAGARFADFVAKYRPATAVAVNYVSLRTPDSQYYVGLDMPSAMHPQTLLAYEMNGLPLTNDHGAPLRLVIPIKYGIKNLKRIGRIQFTNTRPPDYWAERGYDYYAGF